MLGLQQARFRYRTYGLFALNVASCTLDKVLFLISIPRKQCFPPLCHSLTKAPASHIARLAAPNSSANPSFPVFTQRQRHLNDLLLYVLCASKCCIA